MGIKITYLEHFIPFPTLKQEIERIKREAECETLRFDVDNWIMKEIKPKPKSKKRKKTAEKTRF